MTDKIITKKELEKFIEDRSDYQLVDVREKDEIENYGAIPTSKNIPLNELEVAVGLSPDEFEKKYGFRFEKNIRTICYCRSGGRSAQAVKFLFEKGYNVLNYEGSILDWAKTHPEVKTY